MTQIEKLLSIGSDPLITLQPPPEPQWLSQYSLGQELFSMLNRKNGFYAFESALHVFPHTQNLSPGRSLEEWNSDSLWRERYGKLAEGLLFFAEEVFQDQFCLAQEGVFRFRAESGEREFVAATLQEWAGLILLDYEVQTGWTLASKWQAENGALPAGQRLMPKIPFLLGGPYSVENLWAGDTVEGMRIKADLAMQTLALPDGSKIRLIVGEKPRTI